MMWKLLTISKGVHLLTPTHRAPSDRQSEGHIEARGFPLLEAFSCISLAQFVSVRLSAPLALACLHYNQLEICSAGAAM